MYAFLQARSSTGKNREIARHREAEQIGPGNSRGRDSRLSRLVRNRSRGRPSQSALYTTVRLSFSNRAAKTKPLSNVTG